MSKNEITINYKQLGAVALIIINVLIIAPGGWILNALWHDTTSFRNNTQEEFKTLRTEIEKFKTDVSKDYLPRKSFNDYRVRMNKTIIYLDSKLTKKD